MKLAWSSVCLFAASALACGPFFPTSVLDQPDEPLRAPTFAFDLVGILPTNSPWRAASGAPIVQLHADDECRAEYVRGRGLLGYDDPQAIESLRRTRELLVHCAASGEGALAAASIGWEARAELNRGNLIRAGELYVEHYGTGDGTALMSLRLVAAKILEGGADTLLAAARHPQLRRVVTVCLAARGGPFRTPPPPATTVAWLVAVEAADAKELVCADLLAWVAYQAGDFESSGRWLQRAPRESAGGAWLQAKLLLRDGKVEDAAAALAQAVRHFPQSQDWPNATKRHVDCNWRDVPPLDQARGELAVLQLNRGECRDALDLLLRAGYWTDAAYVAERVLSVDELVAYAEGVTDEKLRHLLARRLARLGRYDEARRFLPEPLRPKLAELVAGLLQRDAAGLWQAARILRWHGMELVGTELSPDWFLWGGSYDWGFDGEGRLAPVAEDVQPVLRFHYRYCAAELAWEAATMMPDNSEATARVLCEAGTWLKNRDPQAADRFYKALVLRCRKTDLGQEADRLRWFPKLPPTAMP